MTDTYTNLVSQLKNDYLAYSMAVIVGRAIPSLTDGLKPIQRRILTAMKMLNLRPDGRFMKSARVEGEVMGKYSPHGGSYGSIVTLAAPWNNNLPLVTGHGNWGSSVDPAASSRYTECKLSAFSWDCLLDHQETWPMVDNYDGSLQEPTELNVKVPVVLLNGQEGIGVGFATKIPPHSLRTICESITDNKPLVPYFPTGCQIVDDAGLKSYLETGSGTMRLRAILSETTTEGTGKRAKTRLAFTNLPANTNPEKIGEQIKDGLEKGKLDGISGVVDESDRSGDRVAIIAKANTDIGHLTKSLYYHTDLETTYSAKLLVVDGTKPVELSPSQLIARWKTWRLDRLVTIFNHESEVKESRLHIVSGLLKAISQIDSVIAVIRAAKNKTEALTKLLSKPFGYTRAQADSILEMRLRQLTGLDATQLEAESEQLKARLEQLKKLISSEKQRESYLIKEIKAINKTYGTGNPNPLIPAPDSLTVVKDKTYTPSSKPRYLKIDKKKGVIEQAKGPRGALILEKTDKLIALTADGTLKKLPANYKGPISSEYSEVILARKESEVIERKYLMVFTLDNQLKAMMIAGEDLAKTTSKGKKALPEGASLLHFGENSYTVPWVSSRKKKVELFPVSTKQGKPGGKGVKVANLSDISV